MTSVLFSTIVSNDLGPVNRVLPIAEELSSRGHTVFFCNQAKIPAQMIRERGYPNFPVQVEVVPKIWPQKFSPRIWNARDGMATEGFLDAEYIVAVVRAYCAMLEEVKPDIVVDTWNQRSVIAARMLNIPVVSLMQADLHPAGEGFIWWESPPGDLPDCLPAINQALTVLGLAQVKKPEELFLGDRNLIIGVPELNPLPASAAVDYIGNLILTAPQERLPEWVGEISREHPLVWVYSGNPRYGSRPSIADSIVIIRTVIDALGGEPVNVVLTTGHQPLPDEFKPLPENFYYASFLPGLQMAKRVDLFIHHGGHGSSLTGLMAGTPAVVIPTYSERESNARHISRAGAGEFIVPDELPGNEKFVDPMRLRSQVFAVLKEPRYKQNAQRLAAAFARYDAPVLAANHVEALLRRPEAAV